MPDDANNLNGFSRFWAVYPRKHAKQDAQKAWAKLRPSPGLVDEIVEHVELRKRSKQWRDGYIPLPGSFIRGARWEDELDPQRDFYHAKL